MFLEYPSIVTDLHPYRGSFPGPHLEMVLASMEAGNTAGRMWMIPPGDAPVLLLWDRGNNVFYLAGDGTPASVDALARLMADDILPQAWEEGRTRFKVGPLSPSLEEHLPTFFPNILLAVSHTLFSVYDAARPLPTPHSVPQDVSLFPITPGLLTDGLRNAEYVRAEIRAMWPSEERFYHHGFGVLAIRGEEIICWCTAEYTSAERCGIGIETVPAHQGHGVATATAARFVREARARGITPCWECARSNLPSVRVAEKVGFAPVSEETYWLGSLHG
jgi:RimJ/RimL family protein N-acetyltransferase